MTGLRLIAVPPEHLAAAWPEVGPLLEGAAATTTKLTTADFVTALDQRKMQLWAAYDTATRGILVSELWNYPQERVCRLILAAGKAPRLWPPLMPEIEAWARREDCAAVEAVAHPGWERLLAPHGFAKTHIVLEKRL